MSHAVRRAGTAVFALALCCGSLSAQQFQRIQNRFRPTQFLHTEAGAVQAGDIQPGWWSADWAVEPVAGSEFVRLRNRHRADHYIHIEHGAVSSSPLGDPGWHSAQWAIDRSAGAPWVRFRNRWRSEVFLHTENNRLEAGAIQPGWWSAQWAIVPSPNVTAQISQPHPQPARAEIERILQRLESDRYRVQTAMRTGSSPALSARLRAIDDSIALLRPQLGQSTRPVNPDAERQRQLQEQESRRLAAGGGGAMQPIDPPHPGGTLPGCPSAQGCRDFTDGLMWRLVRGGQIPVDALESGYEPTPQGRRPLYVCRVTFAVAGREYPILLAGKTGPGFSGCNVPWGGVEIAVNNNGYEIMIGALPGPLNELRAAAWVDGANGTLPGRMVQGLGDYATCRAWHNNGWHPGGRVVPGQGCAFGYGDRELISVQYQALVRP